MTEQYELVTLYDFSYIEGTQQVFHSSAYLKINDDEYQDAKDNQNSVCYIHLDYDRPISITVIGIHINQFSNF